MSLQGIIEFQIGDIHMTRACKTYPLIGQTAFYGPNGELWVRRRGSKDHQRVGKILSNPDKHGFIRLLLLGGRV